MAARKANFSLGAPIISERDLIAPLTIGDRVSFQPAHVDVPPDLGSSVIEDGFEVESTARSVVYIHRYRTRWRQHIGTQEIDGPEPGTDVRDVNFYNRHPRIVGELDPPIQREGGRSGTGLYGAKDRPRYNRVACDLGHFQLRQSLVD
jgi:hypothetical protein